MGESALRKPRSRRSRGVLDAPRQNGSRIAKISPPHLAEAYPRGRLFERLDQARRSPVIWIEAPAGAGKTTLVASYLKSRGLRPIWYQADECDRNAASFFYYLRTAAQHATPRRRPLALLTPEYAAGLSAFTRNFFREFYTRLPRPGVLVLDNYQEIPAASALHELLPAGLAGIRSNPKNRRGVFVSSTFVRFRLVTNRKNKP